MNPSITTIHLGFANAYLLRGSDGFVLIDTGLPQLWDRLDTALSSAGCGDGKLRLVILTHADWDHTGNAVKVREKYGAKLAMHPADARTAATGDKPKRSIRLLSFRITHSIERLKRRFKKGGAPQPPVFKPDVLFVDGQSLEEYGIDAKIVHLPGHTKGSLGVVTGAGDLFSGDTLVSMKGPVKALIIENRDDLEKSIARLKEMRLKTVYPGHGRPFPISRFFLRY